MNCLRSISSDLAGSTEEEESTSEGQYVFVDPKSQHLLALVERLATTKAAVLLQGQTGTGKEIVARTLHAFVRSRQCAILLR